MSKKAKRKKDRPSNREMRIAAKADIWTDREGKARPTPQRKLKGVFRLREGDDAGVSIAVDISSSAIQTLERREEITERQAQAGEIFEEVMRNAVGSPSGRSCINFDPVGHDAEDNAEAVRRWRSLQRMVAPADRRECERVCWEHAEPVSIDRLRRGLDATADWAGLEK